MDFYSEDLAFVVDGLRNNVFTKEKEKMLIDYILGLSRYGIGSDNAPHRFDVIKPKNEEDLYQFMAYNLTAAKAPIGKWPSKFMPALMQQIAINMAISEDVDLPIFSVNGPPGTGKTTLLKEVIVSNIVEKARLLADYEDPDEAFDDYLFKNGDGPDGSYNQYVRKYHRLKNKKINAYSVLVVSNNNTAVENITKELPVENKILEDTRPSKEIKGQNDLALAELSKLFTVSESTGRLPFTKKFWENYIDRNGKKKKRHKEVVENQPDIYFSRLATDLLNAEAKNKDKQQAFGLISATLGKKSNIDKVENNVIRPLLDIMKKNDDITQRKQNYLDARQKFLLQLELVLQLQIKLDEVPVKEKEFAKLRKKVEKIKSQEKAHQKKQQSLLPEIDRDIHNQQDCISELGTEKKKTEDRISSIHAVCTDFETKIKNQQDDMTAIQSRIDKLETNISILDRLFKNAKYKEVQITIDRERKKKIQCQKEIEALNKSLFDEKQKEISEQNELNKLLDKINVEDKKINELRLKRENAVSKGKKLKHDLANVQKEVDERKKQLDELMEWYQNQDAYDRGFILDQHFISDILSTDMDVSTKAQIMNPWISEHYNREREKLFLYALQMTKEFILGSRKCRDNFKHLDCLWSGSYGDGERIKFKDDDLCECTVATYETLFLLIPVVSSTFASVQKLFKDLKEQNVIGTLVVDEAGQACPHMAIGSLCRARKAVIVGGS